jgi:exopolysaccharide biosynthesis polyprenyl glycosylphosphotransferase
MKKSELTFNLVSILVDLLMIIVAGIAAFYLRFRLADVRPILFELSLSDYVTNLFLVSPIIIALLALAGLYNLKGTRRISSELMKIVLATSSGLLAVVILFFFNQTLFPSRIIILLTWLLAIVLIGVGRIILRALQVRMLKNGVGLHKLVVVDTVDNRNAKGLVNEITNRPELGYKVIETMLYRGDAEALVAELEKTRNREGIDEILQANPYLPAEVNARILRFARDYGILYNFVPDVFQTSRANLAVETISGVPVIVHKGTPLEGWGRVIKRIMDIFISIFALIVLSPILVVTSLILKLSSRGPVFFHQPRAAGLGQFECYKFRSMYYEMSEGTAGGDKLRAELEKQNSRQGPYVKIKNDPRVMPFGRFIRKTKIDELPQLWHILRGQMSLVGPRVHMVTEVDHFRSDYKWLFTIKPGATGLTQIMQATEKPEISWDEEIKMDAFYIENWSIWLDLKVIFKTVLILLGRKPKADY